MSGATRPEYGCWAFDFPLPQGFAWACPVDCGCTPIRPGPLCQGEGALLALVLDGTGEALAAGERIPYGPGSLLLASQAAQLRFFPAGEGSCRYLRLSRPDDAFDALLAAGQGQPAGQGGGAARLEQLIRAAAGGTWGSCYAACSAVFGMIMAFLEDLARRPARYSPLVQQAIRLMGEEYPFLSGVDALAERLGVSAGHLIRRFKAETGTSPGQFLQSVRLENACLMLRWTDHTVETVAELVGYSGANYFCKAFRRARQMSPGEYRARFSGRPGAREERLLRRLEAPHQL